MRSFVIGASLGNFRRKSACQLGVISDTEFDPVVTAGTYLT